MQINNIIQKKKLLEKIGLGKPEMKPIRMSQQQNDPKNPSPQQPKPQQPQQPQTAPKPSKPGCGGCRRKRS